MYKNIGGKIKCLAKWLFALGAIGSVIWGFVLLVNAVFPAVYYILLGPLVAWVSSWVLYGFGELVEDTHTISQKICSHESVTEQKPEERAGYKTDYDTYRGSVEKCHEFMKEMSLRCESCGKKSNKLIPHIEKNTLGLDVEIMLCEECTRNFYE